MYHCTQDTMSNKSNRCCGFSSGRALYDSFIHVHYVPVPVEMALNSSASNTTEVFAGLLDEAFLYSYLASHRL